MQVGKDGSDNIATGFQDSAEASLFPFIHISLVLDVVTLLCSDPVHNLGILLDSHLQLEEQEASVNTRAFGQLWFVHHLQRFLDYDSLHSVTQDSVTSRLDCYNVPYMGLPLKSI